MGKILSHIRKAFLEILPAFIFFLIMFHILVITRVLTLRQFGIIAPSSAIAVIGALIIAKVIFIADKIPFLNTYPKKPLIWNIILKTVIFSVVALIFLVAEEMIHQAQKYGSLATARNHLKMNLLWYTLWLRQMWLGLLLLFYCTATEFVRVIGAGRVREILFGQKKGKE